MTATTEDIRQLHREVDAYLAFCEIAYRPMHPAIRAHKFGMRKNRPYIRPA